MPLTQGKVALVDDEDYKWLSVFKWYPITNKAGNTYAWTGVKQLDGKWKTKRMHRMILEAPDGVQVDHVNHEGLDNRRANIRLCTASQNLCNRRKIKDTTSIYKGVYWCPRNKKWRAQIYRHGTVHLGMFTHQEDAAEAYNKAALSYYGAFAHLNALHDTCIDM